MTVCEKLARGYFRQLVDQLRAFDRISRSPVERLHDRLARPRLDNRKLNARMVGKAYAAFEAQADSPLFFRHYRPMRPSPGTITLHRPFHAGHSYQSWDGISDAVGFEIDAFELTPKVTRTVQMRSPVIFGTHVYRRLLVRRGASDALDSLRASYAALPDLALWALALLESPVPEDYIDLLALGRNGVFCGTLARQHPATRADVPYVTVHGKQVDTDFAPAHRQLLVVSTFMARRDMSAERCAALDGLEAWFSARRPEIDRHFQDLAVTPVLEPPESLSELARELAAEAVRLGIPELFRSRTEQNSDLARGVGQASGAVS
jgi:hypothetical protein